jgi:glycosyltransferase involved in cell wall biosynthesis
LSSISVRILSVVPSPYQRDVFRAWRQVHDDLRVYYQERTPHDSPWPPAELEPWESILPGFALNWGRGRSHLNHGLPPPRAGDFWVLNTAMTSLTGQRLMRRLGGRQPWAFWGEVPSTPATAIKRLAQRWLYRPLRRARFIAAVGEAARRSYQDLIPGVPVINVPYACDLTEFWPRAPQDQSEAEPLFLFCGQMIPRKGIDLLLAAFRRVLESGHVARLILAGREANVAAVLRELPSAVSAHIELVGFQAPAALPALFGRADVFVLPSRHDGWGVVVNQALGAGLPIIVSARVGASELITPGREGLIVPAGDVEALAAAMMQMVAAPAVRARMGQAARQRSLELTPARAARDMMQAISNTAVA